MSELALPDRLSAIAGQALAQPGVAAALPRPGRAVPMHQLLANFCLVQGCGFTQKGAPCDPLTVMSPAMFLPVIAWNVQGSGQDLLGVDLGCSLRLDQDSLFGARAVVPHVTGHIVDVFRALFFMHAATNLFGLRPNASIEVNPIHDMLREHFQGFLAGLTATEGEIPWPHPQPLN